MKLLIFACLAVAALANPIYDEPEWVEIDWSKVVPVTEMPGFWDGRSLRPSEFVTSKRESRIVGGSEATPHSRPFQVALIMTSPTGNTICGGSVISSSRILTAAHCSVGTSSTQVIAGAHNHEVNEATQQRATVPSGNYRIHEAYNPNNLNNDVSVLILPGTFSLNQYVSAIGLADPGQGTFVGASATMSGWGRVSDVGGLASTLRFVVRPVISNVECAATYGSTIIDSTICVSTTGGQGTCHGDSGGPLTVQEHGGVLIGVVSFVASAGCEIGFPAGFARVSSFREWIQRHF